MKFDSLPNDILIIIFSYIKDDLLKIPFISKNLFLSFNKNKDYISFLILQKINFQIKLKLAFSNYCIIKSKLSYAQLLDFNFIHKCNRIEINKLLNIAVKNSHLEIIKFLLDNGANKYYAFKNTIKYNCTSVLKLLISSYNIKLDIFSNLALRKASFDGLTQTVEVLIQNGIDVHAINNIALCSSACNGHIDIVKLLIDNGANIHADSEYALINASKNGHYNVVKLLIDKGAIINNNALIKATYMGHFNIVKLLIELGTNIDIHIDNDYLLRISLSKGYIHIVKLLVNYDNANIINYINYKALINATRNGHIDIVKFILEYKYKFIEIDLVKLEIALMSAIYRNHLDIVKLLLTFFTNKDKINNAIITRIIRMERTDILKIYLDKIEYFDNEYIFNWILHNINTFHSDLYKLIIDKYIHNIKDYTLFSLIQKNKFNIVKYLLTKIAMS